MPKHPTIPYHIESLNPEETARRGEDFLQAMSTRRTVRMFSTEPVPEEVIRRAVATAGTAPSGANLQPWTFVAVSDPALKKEIRAGAEEEERRNYGGRMSETWLDDLAHLGTDEDKPMLEDAPWLIVVFRQNTRPDGRQNYYVQESVGLATGLLLASLRLQGLATLTHTPSPMNFLCRILDRPANERPYLLIPVGYPAEDCRVPDIRRKEVEEIFVIRK